MVEQRIVERFDGADVVPLMTADEARACVIAINNHLNGARAELLRLYEGRGWSALGYASWRECVVNEFDKSKTHLYRQLEAAHIEQRISPIGEIGTIPEAYIRPLSKLSPIEQAPAWIRAREIADEEGERMATRHVEQAVREWKADDQNVFTDPQADAYEERVEARNTRVNAGLFSSATPEWYTPQHIIARVIQVFGQIDLDPCSNSADPDEANVPAMSYWTQADDGLTQTWKTDPTGYTRVYMNPPYGDEIGAWVERLVEAYASEEIGCAIALLPARTDTAWFQPLFDYAICFIRGRLKFSGADNSAPFPSVVVYLGDDMMGFQDAFGDIGRIK